MTDTVFLCSTVAGWMTLDARVTAVEVAGKRADTQTSKDVARIEVALTERIRNNENVLERFGLNYREDLRDVKGALTRIEDKLDKKADKTR
jgi:hypothetical protein